MVALMPFGHRKYIVSFHVVTRISDLIPKWRSLNSVISRNCEILLLLVTISYNSTLPTTSYITTEKLNYNNVSNSSAPAVQWSQIYEVKVMCNVMSLIILLLALILAKPHPSSPTAQHSRLLPTYLLCIYSSRY